MDGLQGHLSSFDFLPAWTQTWHRRNIFTDPDVVAGQAEYLRTLAAALADRPNFLGMTLGNEINQFSGPPHPDPDTITPEQAGRWLRTLLDACEEGAPGRLHLHAEYDAAWYQDDHAFTPAHAARIGAVTAVHSWVFNGTAQRHGRTGTATEHHAAYLIELSKAWATDPHRPVWLQEVGAPAPLVPAEHAAAFTEATVVNALDCEDVWGVTWWCSHDVSRSLADFPELEYSLGLLTNDRQVKPWRGHRRDRRGPAGHRVPPGAPHHRTRRRHRRRRHRAPALHMRPRWRVLRGVRPAHRGRGPAHRRPREPGREPGTPGRPRDHRRPHPGSGPLTHTGHATGPAHTTGPALNPPRSHPHA